MYGHEVISRYRLEEGDIDVIGEIETTSAGNVALRIGRTIGKERGHGWHQIAYVVLGPDEVEALTQELRGQAAGNEWVVVDTEGDRGILGRYVRREEDSVLYLPPGGVPGEEVWAPDDCTEVMSRYRYEQGVNA